MLFFMSIKRFEGLECWRLARVLTQEVYRVSGQGQFAKDFELRGQVRSAAGSTMHNGAEGFDAGTNPEFARFLRIAQRSCTEVQSELYVALDQSYIPMEEFQKLYELAAQVHRCIGGLIRYLIANPKPVRLADN
jgi:four helix bundle protein